MIVNIPCTLFIFLISLCLDSGGTFFSTTIDSPFQQPALSSNRENIKEIILNLSDMGVG